MGSPERLWQGRSKGIFYAFLNQDSSIELREASFKHLCAFCDSEEEPALKGEAVVFEGLRRPLLFASALIEMHPARGLPYLGVIPPRPPLSEHREGCGRGGAASLSGAPQIHPAPADAAQGLCHSLFLEHGEMG